MPSVDREDARVNTRSEPLVFLTGVGCSVRSDALPAPRPVREVRVWRPKRETPQVEPSEDQLAKRQSEASASRQTQEARAHRRGAQQPTLSQVSLLQRSRQQRESRVSYQQRRQTRVTQPRRDSRVSETCVQAEQHTTVSRRRRCETTLFNPPPTDLRDYLTRKRSANQATSPCCCQQLIQMLSGCHCESGVHQPSLIRQLTLIPPAAKRKRSHRRRTFSDVEYPELTAYMTSRSKGKQPKVSSDESDSGPEGVYQHTRTRTGAIPPVNYNALARGIRMDDSHSAVIESQASNSSVEKETSAYMTGTPAVSYTHLTLPTIYSV